MLEVFGESLAPHGLANLIAQLVPSKYHGKLVFTTHPIGLFTPGNFRYGACSFDGQW